MPERARSLAERLDDAEFRFSTLLDLTADAIVCADERHRIVVFNRGAEEVFGWARDEIIGTPLDTLIPAPVRSAHVGYLERFIERQEKPRRMSERRPMRGLRKNGEVFEADISISNVTLGGARLAMAVIRDVSVLRSMQETTRRAADVEAMGRLAGGVAHDFNNLLTVIRMAGTFVAEDAGLSAAAREDVADLMSAAERASELTRQLLEFGRRQVMKPAVFDLRELVRAREALIGRLMGEAVRVRIELAPEPALILADRGEIERVLVNLVTNARDAMPQGGTLSISVQLALPSATECKRHPEIEESPQICLRVTDSGEGMSTDTREHIFEPFFTTKEYGRGTGLGLASVLGIVHQSGGCVFVESELGAGTTFSVWFPRAAPASGVTPSPAFGQAEPARSRQLPTPRPSVAPVVLVVDDDGAIRGLMRRVFSARGFNVLTAQDATSALTVAERHTGGIHAVISDVVLPGLSGLDLVGELRRRDPNIAVVLVSGHSADALVHHGAMEPRSEFLAKPFTAPQLVETLNRAFDHAWAAIPREDRH
jgi:hypothetical protein